MKKEYIIFYSWMSDRPVKKNIRYIRKKLSDDCRELEKKLGVKITIDSDSRGEDGSKPIEENVMKKYLHATYSLVSKPPVNPVIGF